MVVVTVVATVVIVIVVAVLVLVVSRLLCVVVVGRDGRGVRVKDDELAFVCVMQMSHVTFRVRDKTYIVF